MTGERRRRLFADVADPQRVDQAREIVRLAPFQLRDDVPADLAELPRDGSLRGVPSGCGRIAFTTLGITSPPFSTSTRSPGRRSLRATSSALCSVAIETVVPASFTGSRTAYGVTAPVRPTLTSIAVRVVVACCAGNLKAVAQRGNFAVVPSFARRAR